MSLDGDLAPLVVSIKGLSLPLVLAESETRVCDDDDDDTEKLSSSYSFSETKRLRRGGDLTTLLFPLNARGRPVGGRRGDRLLTGERADSQLILLFLLWCCELLLV